MNTRILSTIAVCTALILPAGAALASGDKIELTEEITQQIRTTLTEQGYDVGKIKIDDGMYEAYAKKDGQRYEIYLNADLETVKTEIDD